MTHRSAGAAGRAIELSLRGDSFTVQDIRRGLEDPPSRATIYRVLRQLETDDWIEQRGNGWQPGVKSKMLGSAGDHDNDSSGRSIDLEW